MCGSMEITMEAHNLRHQPTRKSQNHKPFEHFNCTYTYSNCAECRPRVDSLIAAAFGVSFK